MSMVLTRTRSDLATPEVALRKGLTKLCLDIDRSGFDRFLAFLDLLQKWNRTYSLTAVRDPVKMVSAHLLDSLAVVRYLSARQVLDVGSGAGLPGIPLAIAWPGEKVVLLESNQKKLAFLRQAIATLGLGNVHVIGERVENWHPVQRYDLIISRAYAQIDEFVRSACHLLAEGGVFAAMKGVRPDSELACLPAGFKVRDVFAIAVPGLAAKRHLVILERS